LANEHGLKCAEYGIVILDTSRSSEKQAETFRYNEAGLTRFRELVPPKSDQNLHRAKSLGRSRPWNYGRLFTLV
jgi:hypothetical protein